MRIWNVRHIPSRFGEYQREVHATSGGIPGKHGRRMSLRGQRDGTQGRYRGHSTRQGPNRGSCPSHLRYMALRLSIGGQELRTVTMKGKPRVYSEEPCPRTSREDGDGADPCLSATKSTSTRSPRRSRVGRGAASTTKGRLSPSSSIKTLDPLKPRRKQPEHQQSGSEGSIYDSRSHITCNSEPPSKESPRSRTHNPPSLRFPTPLSLAIHPRVTPKSPPILFPPSLPRANRHWGRSERLATSVEALPSAMQESTQTTKASGRCAATPPAAPSLRGAPHWLPAPGGAGNRAGAAGLHALPRDNGGVCRLSVEGVVRRIECGVKNAYPLGEGPTSFRRTESSHFSSIRPSLILTAPAHQNAIGPLA